jgi:hypothetical protein
VRGEEESQIGLRKGGGGGAKVRGESLGFIIRYNNWQEGSFMVVDGQTGGLLEEL